MGEFSTALEKEETVLGGSPEDAASPGFLDEILVIVLRFISEEGEPEAVLALRLSVTPSAIATMASENRDDFIGETDGNDFPGPAHLYPAGEGGPLVAGRDSSFAIRNDPDEAIGRNLDHSCRVNRVTGQGSSIQVEHANLAGVDYELMKGVRSRHHDFLIAAPGEHGKSGRRREIRFRGRRRGLRGEVLPFAFCCCCCQQEAAAESVE